MSLFTLPEILNKPDRLYQWGQLYGASYGLLLLETAQSLDSPLLVVVTDDQQVDELIDQLSFFAGDGIPILRFPDWETLPYDAFSPHQDIVSSRLEVLYRLPQLPRGIVVMTTNTLMQRLPPVDYVCSQTVMLACGDLLDTTSFRRQLNHAGYYTVPQVNQHGEFAVRGSLIDLFPSGSKHPYRIDLFDDSIESIRTFDPETQRTLNRVDNIRLMPSREFALDKDSINLFRQQFRRSFEGNPKICPVYNDISDGIASSGAEYYLPLFFNNTATLFDYLPTNTILVSMDNAFAEADNFYSQVEERYESYRHDVQRPILAPDQLYIDHRDIKSALCHYTCIDLQHYTHEEQSRLIHNFQTSPVPEIYINARAEDPALLLRQYLQDFSGDILLIGETAGQREMLLGLLHGFGIHPKLKNSWQDFINNPESLCLTVAPINTGMVLKNPHITVISSEQILGKRTRQISSRRRRKHNDQFFNNLEELHIGSPVVHEEHGIGRYLGLQTLHTNGYDEEFLTLEYADQNRLYVPVASLHLINRYMGGVEETAPLHQLGSKQWQKTRRKAIKKIRDIAAELLDIYTRREAQAGYSYQIDHAEYSSFVDGFPFEETEDQLNAIQAVIEDLQSGHPMDRVICGDVGFGKTEVAMRAAFMVIQCNKQVAILSPTTLLTQQHFQNFCDRFANWPVKVGTLSRFNSKQDSSHVINQLASGEVDIVIGTHKLLNKDIRFRDLGLLIIDEEHRFGVRQKEQIKKMRTQVDTLTLTATPIPRTLNMSLSGLRDLSIIATPPMRRLSVKTFVSEWHDQLIQEACQREIQRGGQVYFLHNEVSSIENTAERIATLVPKARITIAHGQMRERQLEQTMLDFYHRRYNVLVCTTIIESGIDIPTANTILMNRADKLGLAQLHQLRGRVGRSHHQAYAYLIIPPRKVMTADATRRIEAVESLEDLGSGFSLASHDLEIRGSGELLGEGQSGRIEEIGYTMYADLLERAVSALKSGKVPEMNQPLHHGPEIELRIPALLPDSYLPDVHARLLQYKRIANAADHAALRELQVDMIDRFGLLPDVTKNLFAVTALKFEAKKTGIRKIIASEAGGKIEFDDQPDIDPALLIGLIQQAPDVYNFDSKKNTLKFKIRMAGTEDRLSTIKHILAQLKIRKAA